MIGPCLRSPCLARTQYSSSSPVKAAAAYARGVDMVVTRSWAQVLGLLFGLS
jgi:hypothetical protein